MVLKLRFVAFILTLFIHFSSPFLFTHRSFVTNQARNLKLSTHMFNELFKGVISPFHSFFTSFR